MWALEGFLDRLNEWIEREHPSGDLRLLVTEWVMTRYDDPYLGARREAGFPNYWLAPIPGSRHHGRVMVCTFFVYERTHSVRCDGFATLSLPL